MKHSNLLFLLFISYSLPVLGETLLDAAKTGDASTALTLLNNDNINIRDSTGTTALHWAVYNDQPELVAALIETGSNVETANNYGASPLGEAAITGNPDVIDMLLAAGADPDASNPEGQTALMVLARTENIEAATVLLEHGADPELRETWKAQNALMWAAARSRPQMISLLTGFGADPNAQARINDWKRQTTVFPRSKYLPAGGLTPMLFSAREGCLECVVALVEAGADINMPNPDEITPLLIAILNARFDVAKFLIEQDADINKWDRWGRTPLYSAIDYKTLPTGGRPDRQSTDDTLPAQLISMLLEKGANPNAQLKLLPPHRNVVDDRGLDLTLTTGATPLMRAARAGDTESVALLLEHGARTDIRQLERMTALMVAAGLRQYSIDTRGKYVTEEDALASTRLILEAGADIKAVEHFGQTALHGAAFRGWNDMVLLLVEYGADLSIKDNDGFTPLDTALGNIRGMGREATLTVINEDTARLIESLALKTP
ncbi:MAG: ankyrin repeat domain-containing protein [Gammaproteobacteria bacterium]|nr:ankyrin repeat domain-containing protein [Gammaproteobacteria bacterium]